MAFIGRAGAVLRSAWERTVAFERRYDQLAMVLIGFALATGWEEMKVHRAEQAELTRAIRSVDQEAELDLAIIAEDKSFLDQDNAFADDHRELVTSIDHLVAGALDAAVLRGSFDAKALALSTRARAVNARPSSLRLQPR
jgi:hypothetical protein